MLFMGLCPGSHCTEAPKMIFGHVSKAKDMLVQFMFLTLSHDDPYAYLQILMLLTVGNFTLNFIT